jgi:hypothetical protein
MTGKWVVTSPTILLAHRPLTMYDDGAQNQDDDDRNYHRTKLTIRDAGVIYMQSEDVFSSKPVLFKAKDGSSMAQKIANGQWRPDPGQLLAGERISYEIKPFDFGHLQDPVPAIQYLEARDDCWGEQKHCATITDDSYRPKLFINRNVWRSVLSDRYYCDLPSMIDPPIALRPIKTLESVQMPAFPTLHSSPAERPSSGSVQPGAPPLPGPRPLAQLGPRPTAGIQYKGENRENRQDDKEHQRGPGARDEFSSRQDAHNRQPLTEPGRRPTANNQYNGENREIQQGDKEHQRGSWAQDEFSSGQDSQNGQPSHNRGQNNDRDNSNTPGGTRGQRVPTEYGSSGASGMDPGGIGEDDTNNRVNNDHSSSGSRIAEDGTSDDQLPSNEPRYPDPGIATSIKAKSGQSCHRCQHPLALFSIAALVWLHAVA